MNIKKVSVYTSEAAKNLITEDDMNFAVDQALLKHKPEQIEYIMMDINDGYVGFTVKTVPFNRVRRITGYLTGGTNTWNNAKQDELAKRIKHDTNKSKIMEEIGDYKK